MTDSPATAAGLWLPTVSLWRREVVTFLRQRSRVMGALGTPVVFWVLIGSGLGKSFRVVGGSAGGDPHYLEYAYPGTLALIVLFTAIFAMISIIEDRKAGFMQAVIAAPVSRLAIVLGKVLGSTTLAVGQSLLFLVLAPIAGVHLTVVSVLALTGVLVLVSLGLSGLGFLVAWPMDSTQGFHAIMNLALMPMWLLSGAFFPASGASTWLAVVMAINPLTYGVTALRHALYLGSDQPVHATTSLIVAVLVTIVFALAMIGMSVFVVERKR